MWIIRSVLNIAASEDMQLAQFDVSTAFLYGELEKSIYMQQPEGYKDSTRKVCELKSKESSDTSQERSTSTSFKKRGKRCGILDSFSDADFGGCTRTSRSTSGVVVKHAKTKSQIHIL